MDVGAAHSVIRLTLSSEANGSDNRSATESIARCTNRPMYDTWLGSQESLRAGNPGGRDARALQVPGHRGSPARRLGAQQGLAHPVTLAWRCPVPRRSTSTAVSDVMDGSPSSSGLCPGSVVAVMDAGQPAFKRRGSGTVSVSAGSGSAWGTVLADSRVARRQDVAGSVSSCAFCRAAHWAAASATGIAGFTSQAASMP